ncbi:MAG: SET domain-containing protein-lysine N-methyltransferase [Bacteroidota bacterium]
MSRSRTSSHVHASLYAVSGPAGRSIIAGKTLPAGTVLAVWGGTNNEAADFFDLSPSRRQISVQVADDLFLVPETEGAAEWINHSCDPNAGLMGQISVVAMRVIRAGEEVCYDYAMSDGCRYDEFECCCGSSRCRLRITGNDWQIPELWERYAGYFSPYLQRRIDGMRRRFETRVSVGSPPPHYSGAVAAVPLAAPYPFIDEQQRRDA